MTASDLGFTKTSLVVDEKNGARRSRDGSLCYSDSSQMGRTIPALTPQTLAVMVFCCLGWLCGLEHKTRKSGVCHQAGLVVRRGWEVPV